MCISREAIWKGAGGDGTGLKANLGMSYNGVGFGSEG